MGNDFYEEDKAFMELTKLIKDDDHEYYLFLLEAYKATEDIDLVRQFIEEMFGQNGGNNFKGNV